MFICVICIKTSNRCALVVKTQTFRKLFVAVLYSQRYHTTNPGLRKTGPARRSLTLLISSPDRFPSLVPLGAQTEKGWQWAGADLWCWAGRCWRQSSSLTVIAGPYLCYIVVQFQVLANHQTGNRPVLPNRFARCSCRARKTGRHDDKMRQIETKHDICWLEH